MFPYSHTDTAARHTRSRLRPPVVALLLFFLTLAVGAEISVAEKAATPAPNASPESLTHTLVALTVRYQLADPSEQAQLLGDLLTVAAARQQLLVELLEDDPGEVLRLALPANLRTSLPPAVQVYVEEEVETEGTLEVLHEDRDPGSRYLYFLEAVAGRFSLHFAADPPTHLETGSQVRVRGVRAGGVLALTSSSSVEPLISVVPNSFGAQKTILILVAFQDKPTPPYTVSTAQSVMTTTSNFYWENPYQQTWLTGVVNGSAAADVYGWFTIAQDSTVCDYNKTASLAEQAATAAGANLSAYSRRVYAFPNNACTWWGLGTVGGNPSKAWINGSFQLRVVGHEMGHGLGLYHSHSMSCDLATCTTSEYGNNWDIMGATSGHFNAFQKERLGWLDYGSSPPIVTAQGSGDYWLDPYETLGAGSKALAVLKSTDATGKRTWYYLENRQKLGFDGSLAAGVVVTTGAESSANSSYLFDLAPTTSTFDALLDVGQSYYDGAAGVTLATLSADSSGALVRVDFGPLACIPGAPTVALAPSGTVWVSPGSTVSYTVTVTNADNSGCSASSFNLAATVPSGSTAFGNDSLTISPGASGSTTLQVTSPSTATGGFYTVSVTATNTTTSLTASTSATQMLVSSLTVTVTTDKASYTRNPPQTVTITATVSANGSPVANASVTFTITKVIGGVITGTATTGTNGSAVYKYRLKKQDPVGNYQVTVNANLNNAIVGTGSANFTVK